MAVPTRLLKLFTTFRGLDLRVSDLLRDRESATAINNMTFRQTGAMSKRKGYQIMSRSATGAGYGLTTYSNVNTTTGIITEELISIDDNLQKRVGHTFVFAYTGSGSGTFYNVLLSPTDNKFYFNVYENNSVLTSVDLGTGLEVSPVTVTSLVSTLNALTDFTCGTLSGGGSEPAAQIPQTINVAVGAGATIPFNIISDISLPGSYTTPFSTFLTKKTTSDFENASFSQINNILYIATGYEALHKYDGTRVYKAGLPQATTPTAASSGTDGSTFTVGRKIRYKIEIEHTDAKGNIIYGTISSHVEVTVDGSGNSIDVTYTELAASSGYDTDGALKYNIYRTDESLDASATSLYYLIHSADPGDTIPYKDVADALGAEFVPPIKDRGLPPVCKYVDVWRGQLILSGDITSVDTTYYSDIESPEYFPIADNSFQVSNKVTGLKSLDNNLYIFQQHSIDSVTGDFGTGNFQVDSVSRGGIGCAAHHTIQEVKGRLMFLSDKGVMAISTEGLDTTVGHPIEPKFQRGHQFSFKQAVGYNWIAEDKYLLFMPNLPVDSSYSNDSLNEIYVYNHFREAWLEWHNFNFMGGMTEVGNDLYFCRRVVSLNNITRLSQDGTQYDYADHTEAISFAFKSHWETMGDPSIWKKFLRCKIHSYDTSLDDFETQSFTLTLKTENDFIIATRTNIDYDFSGGSIGWGLSPWGSFPWSESRLQQLKKKLASKKVRSMRVLFSNDNIHENILISGYELEVVAPYGAFLKE